MFNHKNKRHILCLILILIIVFTSYVGSYADEAKELYDMYRSGDTAVRDNTVTINKNESVSLHFNVLYEFDELQIFIVSPCNDRHITFSLFTWESDSKTTIAGRPICDYEYTGWEENNWLEFKLSDMGISSMPAGEYVLRMTSEEGEIDLKLRLPAIKGAKTYINGITEFGSIHAKIHFSKAVNDPFRDVSENTNIQLNTAPPKSEISEDSAIAKLNVDSDQWTVIDGLGRTLPSYKDVGGIKEDKYVGIFYWTWHNSSAVHNRPININQLMLEYPGIDDDYDDPRWAQYQAGAYFWNEPLYGYYSAMDKYVLRKHAELLADAGVDFIAFDCTNGDYTWESSYMSLLETFKEARDDGIKTPQITFMMQFGSTDNTRSSINQVYNAIYRDGRYQDQWFYWEGKPLLMAHNDILDETLEKEKELLDFFTYRKTVASYFDGNDSDEYWGWLHVYPQALYKNKDGSVEQTTVGTAQNANYETWSLSAMNSGKNMGRSYSRTNFSYEYEYRGKTVKVNKDIENASFYGINQQEQWEYAIAQDPEIIFVTGWNEWIMGRFEYWGNVECAFPDQYNDENSRDIEPSKGLLKDYYYYQLVANIRRFKGMNKPLYQDNSYTIDITGDVAQWDNEGIIAYNHYAHNTYDRDIGTWLETHYENHTMRNDIIQTKTAYDSKNIYFYVKTLDTLTPHTDKAWMRLFLDTAIAKKGSLDWEEYEYCINRINPTDSVAYVERSLGGWNWETVGEVRYTVNDNILQIEVPRKLLGLTDSKLAFNFKWSDNMQIDGDIMDFYSNGDAAPEGRFMFSFSSYDRSKSFDPIYIILPCVAVLIIALAVLFTVLKKRTKAG